MDSLKLLLPTLKLIQNLTIKLSLFMIQIVNSFLQPEQLEQARDGFIAAGFGKWEPESHLVGSGVYDGMGFMGNHALFVSALMGHVGRPIIPNSMFARITNKDTERAYVHSDRASGAFTCIVYLSDHEEKSGTAFYRHRETGLTEMPLEWMTDEKRKNEMVNGDESIWQEMDYVAGGFNRAVIFNAPLFHARVPKNGFGSTPEDGRLVHVIHFFVPQ